MVTLLGFKTLRCFKQEVGLIQTQYTAHTMDCDDPDLHVFESNFAIILVQKF